MAFNITVPKVTFKTRREIDEAPGFEWYDLTSAEMFTGKRVVLFALPGAFTPTCSSTHLPGYEMEYDKLLELGMDEVYCLSINDTFVMNSWMSSQEVTKVKPVPDGTGEFTRRLGFLVDKSNIGFGMRSWRYSMIIDDGVVEEMFVEPGLCDNADGDPFEVSDVYTMLEYLQGED
jgi:peroxiredoxin|tara:strand:- start:286 stop:810 length:525 start_codon:yes stop_codon:yes gene_type:complete